MNNVLKKYFDNLYNNKRISHAFLICNSTYDNLKDELTLILSDYFFNFNVNIEDCLDIYLIKPQNGKIVKEQILDLEGKLKTKSQFNENKVYIIDKSHLMNDYAANALLKTLEEPATNIFAFLITDNIDNVLPTIKSRCQIIMIDNTSFFNFKDYDSIIVQKAVDVVVCIENYGINSLAYIYDFINKKEDKEEFRQVIRIMKYIYRDILNYKLFFELKYFDLYCGEIKELALGTNEIVLVNKLIILNKAENMLEYNLNLNLFLDKLIIEMGMLNDE